MKAIRPRSRLIEELLIEIGRERKRTSGDIDEDEGELDRDFEDALDDAQADNGSAGQGGKKKEAEPRLHHQPPTHWQKPGQFLSQRPEDIASSLKRAREADAKAKEAWLATRQGKMQAEAEAEEVEADDAPTILRPVQPKQQKPAQLEPRKPVQPKPKKTAQPISTPVIIEKRPASIKAPERLTIPKGYKTADELVDELATKWQAEDTALEINKVLLQANVSYLIAIRYPDNPEYIVNRYPSGKPFLSRFASPELQRIIEEQLKPFITEKYYTAEEVAKRYECTLARVMKIAEELTEKDDIQENRILTHGVTTCLSCRLVESEAFKAEVEALKSKKKK